MTLTQPSDLNGALHVWLVPLKGPARGLFGASVAKPLDIQSPFLAARATLTATDDRTWEGEPVASFWSWPNPVLLATREVHGDATSSVTFGRSARTLAEESESDQPLVGPESSSWSLWHVSGMGLVLCLEKLVVLNRSDQSFAEQADQLGAMLSEPLDEQSSRLQQDFKGRGDVADASGLIEYFTGDRRCSLHTLLGDAVSDIVGAETPLVDMLLPRRTAVAGRRQLEGLFVSVASLIGPLGVDALLLRGHPDKPNTFEESDHEQAAGFLWQYSPVSMALEPADTSAVCALRSDGHVAILDMDAFSIYHDYLDNAAGGHTLTTLIPLVALLGQRAQDFWLVADGIRSIAEPGAPRETAERLHGLRVLRDAAEDVRIRMELRRLLQDQLFNEPSFVTWTNPEHLRRSMARLALADVVKADHAEEISDDPLAASLLVLDAVLERQMRGAELDLHRAELELQRLSEQGSQKAKSVLQGVAGVLAGAGLLGLFAALAAVPEANRVVGSLVAAGLWTLLAATLIGSVTAAGWALLKQKPPQQLSRQRPLQAVTGMCGLVALVACVGGLLVSAPLDFVLLIVAGLAFLAGAGLVLWHLPSPMDASSSESQLDDI